MTVNVQMQIVTQFAKYLKVLVPTEVAGKEHRKSAAKNNSASSRWKNASKRASLNQNKEKKRNLGLSSPSKFSDMITSIGGKYRTATGAYTAIAALWACKSVNEDRVHDDNVFYTNAGETFLDGVNDTILTYMAEALPTVYSLLPKHNMDLEELYFNHKSNMFEYWNSKIHLGIDPNARVSEIHAQ